MCRCGITIYRDPIQDTRMKSTKLITALVISSIFTGCQLNGKYGDAHMSVTKESFGKTNGKEVYSYTLNNGNGIVAKLINYGAILTELHLTDKNQNVKDVVLGYDNLQDYINDDAYLGVIAGRYANRIAKGKFTLNGVEYTLATNNGPNHLHGGNKGFSKVVWDAEPLETEEGPAVKFTYQSRDGEEGYPGNLTVSVTYILNYDNELKIYYEAQTDKTTVINLTHHSYFNLAGHDSGNILGQFLTINADRFTEVDDTSIPTGQLIGLKGSAMDFTAGKKIGQHIDEVKGGYDHNYVLNKPAPGQASLAAKAYDSQTGLAMEIVTTEPGVQFYTGNYLNNIKGKAGTVYDKHAGFCLEAQHFPDSPNHPEFPTTVLNPGETYTQLTVHKFYIE